MLAHALRSAGMGIARVRGRGGRRRKMTPLAEYRRRSSEATSESRGQIGRPGHACVARRSAMVTRSAPAVHGHVGVAWAPRSAVLQSRCARGIRKMVDQSQFWDPANRLKFQWGKRLRRLRGLGDGSDRSQREPMVRAEKVVAGSQVGLGADGGRPPHRIASRSVFPREEGRLCGPIARSLLRSAKLVDRSQLRGAAEWRKRVLNKGLRPAGDGRAVDERSQTEPVVGVGLEQDGSGGGVQRLGLSVPPGSGLMSKERHQIPPTSIDAPGPT